jgi:P-type Ca2+ transporter type 2C
MLQAEDISLLPYQELVIRLDSRLEGLTTAEAERRLLQYSSNQIKTLPPSLLSSFTDQFKNPLIILLLISSLISFLMNQILDAISILLTVLIVLTVAFVQEYQSMQSLEALKKLVVPFCHVKRNNQFFQMPAQDLVPGDIIRLGLMVYRLGN